MEEAAQAEQARTTPCPCGCPASNHAVVLHVVLQERVIEAMRVRAQQERAARAALPPPSLCSPLQAPLAQQLAVSTPQVKEGSKRDRRGRDKKGHRRKRRAPWGWLAGWLATICSSQ